MLLGSAQPAEVIQTGWFTVDVVMPWFAAEDTRQQAAEEQLHHSSALSYLILQGSPGQLLQVNAR